MVDGPRHRRSALSSRFSEFEDDDDWGGRSKRKQRRRGGSKKNRYDVYEDDVDDSSYDDRAADRSSVARASGTIDLDNAEESALSLRELVEVELSKSEWKTSELDDEQQSEGSCWHYRGELRKAVQRVGEGLVDREEEARLVVLGMVAEEHVLFLGPPGTAKSVLGRRLSQLCGGTFFQRLLTRFTTPEEIFGPLSLQALVRTLQRFKGCVVSHADYSLFPLLLGAG